MRSCKPHVLFVDFKAAFDSVDHELLFEKLRRYDISEDTIGKIKLLYSYAHTKMNENDEPIPINMGVLQGSLISPILFN